VSRRARNVAEALECFLEERRAGAAIGAREFATRYPEFGRALLDALESAEAVEQMQAERGAGLDRTLPERIGPFRVVREIGRGGMGVVLEAVEEPLGRRVALKLLPPELVANPDARARLEREATLAARIEHPGVCAIYGAHITDPRPWIAMRFVEGMTLSQCIARARERSARCAQLPPFDNGEGGDFRAMARCLARVARALAAAHAHGVLHRDVKPSNVMVPARGEPVLLDFGLAIEPTADTPNLTRTGETAGTPAYLAPELLAGELQRPDELCDVYALGVTLYECLALQPPFRAPTREALYAAVLAGDASDVARLRRGVPRDLGVIVATAMERERTRRYAGAEQLALDLEAFAGGRPIAARPLGAIGRLARWARREPRQAALAGALASAALVAAVAVGDRIATRGAVDAGLTARRAAAIEAILFDAFAAYGDLDYDAADAHFERVLSLDPANADAQVGQVLLRLSRKRPDEALMLLASKPHTPAYDGLRAMARGEPPLQEDPAWLARADPFELFIEGDRLLIEAGRRPQSERADWARRAMLRFENAVARAPRARGMYHVLWSVSASLAGDERAARAASAGLIALWPQSPRALFQAAFGIGDFDSRAALALLERSLALEPDYAPALINLGVAYERLGMPEAARASYERALAVDPARVDGYVALANLQFELGCRDEARALLIDAIGLDPYCLRAWSGLQSFAVTAEDSVQAAEHVLELDPGQVVYRNSYALALEYLGRQGAACEQFSICVAQAPREPSYWHGYVRTLIASGQGELAMQALRAAREFAPEDAGLEELERRAGVTAMGGR
jgi:serine/threonine protein kinase/tetratricopeptide (TPR) repeat protein